MLQENFVNFFWQFICMREFGNSKNEVEEFKQFNKLFLHELQKSTVGDFMLDLMIYHN